MKIGSKRFLKILSIIFVVFLYGWIAPPHGLASSKCPTITTNGGGTYQYPTSVTLNGTIQDAVGGTYSYQWLEGQVQYCASSTPVTVTAKKAFQIPACTIDTLFIGTHNLTLHVAGGLPGQMNTCNSTPVAINIIDKVAPKLAPVVTPTILWPPNNQLVPVIVTPNASDNSGVAPAVKATITSNELVIIVGKKPAKPWYTPIYLNNGNIEFVLPAQRLQTGNGRVYTIYITATDASGNSSTATVEVKVPHDQTQ
jgi:hypothetical protein